MSQSSYFKSRPDLLTLGGVAGGNLKSWKTFRVEGSVGNMVEKMITSLRCVIVVTGTDLLSLEWGGGLMLKNLKK